jgi:hypothetical protein
VRLAREPELEESMNGRPIGYAALVAILSACDVGPYCSARILDACAKAEQMAAFVGEELASSATTGNAIVGQGSALHHLGSVALSVRTNTTRRTTPQLGEALLRTDGEGSTGNFTFDDGTATSLSADVAIGVVPGFAVGETRVLGVDLLGSLTAVPGFDNGGLTAHGGGIGFGTGLRLGVLAETRALPAVSLSASVRQLPSFTLTNRPLRLADGGWVTLGMDDLDVTTRAIRVAASKQFGRFGMTGGLGKDWHDITGKLRVESLDRLDQSMAHTTSQDVTRTTAFAGASFALGRAATLSAEVGRLSGTDDRMAYNMFTARSGDGARTFVTVGMRLATSLVR